MGPSRGPGAGSTGAGAGAALPGATFAEATFSPSGTKLVTLLSGGRLALWPETGRGDHQLLDLPGDTLILSFAVSDDGRWVAVGTDDGRVVVQSTDGQGAPHELGDGPDGHRGPVRALAFSPDPQWKRLVSGSDDGTAKVWAWAAEADPLVLDGHEDRVHTVAFDPDSKRILTASRDGTARIWDPGRAAGSRRSRASRARAGRGL